MWRKGDLHLLRDMRHPLLEPRQAGLYRNIYAPSAVRVEGGWRLFYGAWDGIDVYFDWIYSVFTKDFIDFGARETILNNGVFMHVCNVNALALAEGGFEMMYTVYPDKHDRNKPAYFKSPDGITWNGRSAPYPADYKDIVKIDGYPDYEDADVNGMNVIFREGDKLRLYFNNFRKFGKVFRAESQDGKNFVYKGVALECNLVVNDVKRFEVNGGHCWLMGLHMNREGLWYSLSPDGDTFSPEQPLLTHAGPEDLYIVALGWVTDGNRVLGVLYGAGAVPELNRNRIFARWLQKRVVFTSEDGTVCEPAGAVGPNRQIIRIPEGVNPRGALQVFAENGTTPLGNPIPIKNAATAVLRLVD
ncbi:MAG: hypothetical protein GXY44_04960 [Phycisphaerales bacterium]|nr:hypothetical protein [Phycisphaerales bacterium]